MHLLGIIPELLHLPLLQLPELKERPLNHIPVNLDRETVLIQAPSTLQLISPQIIPLHKIVGMHIKRDLGGDEGLYRDLLLEATVDSRLLLRVVWAREATGDKAGESAF